MKSKLLLIVLIFFALILFEAEYLVAQKPYGHGILTEFTKIKLDSSEGLSSSTWYHTGNLTASGTITSAGNKLCLVNASNYIKFETDAFLFLYDTFGAAVIKCAGLVCGGLYSDNIASSGQILLSSQEPKTIYTDYDYNQIRTTLAQQIDTSSVFIDASAATPKIATADTDGVISTTKFVIKKTILYSDRGSSVTIKEFASSVVIWSIIVEVVTAFNGSGSDLLDIGITGTGNRYKDDLDVSATGWTTTMDANIPDRMTATTQIIAQYFDQNSDATQGSLDIYLEYTIH